MYSINGVALDNSALGWVFRPASVPYVGMEADVVAVRATGMDGARTGMSTYGSPTIRLTVDTPIANLETLNALFRSQDLTIRKTGVTSRYANITLIASEVGRVHNRGQHIEMSYYVQIDGAYWRDSTVTTSTAVNLVSSSTVTVANLFPGSSAPIQDAMIRVRGNVTLLRVSDTAGSWFTFDSIGSGNYIRFEMATNRVWATSSNTWEGGTEVSGRLDFGGPRDVFEITPQWSTSTPNVRAAVLTVQTGLQSSAQIEVRGRGAYIE